MRAWKHDRFDVVFCGMHKRWGGLNNNGGSKTIIRSTETLEKLGYSARICARVDKFKYFKHRPPTDKFIKTKHVVAIDIHEMDIIKLFNAKAHAIWLRAWPIWQMPSKEILKRLGEFKGRIICNSSWLVRKLEKHDIKAHLCFAGYDEIWTDKGRPESSQITIGGLNHLFHKTKNYKLYKALKKVLEPAGYKFLEIGLKVQDDRSLKSLYQRADIWFAPTELEGFHNVPMEANLCGNLVVCSDHPRNGMDDYANKLTAEVYEFGNFKHAVDLILNARFNKVKNMQQWIKDKIKTRSENMKRFINILEGKYD